MAQYANYNKNNLSKSFVIDKFDFTIAITREVALLGMRRNPRGFELAQSSLLEEYNNLTTEEEYFAFFKDNKKASLFLDQKNELEEISIEICNFLLPIMLKLGKTDLKEYANYEDYAQALLNFCGTNGLLENYSYEEDDGTEVNCEGLYSILWNFITLGFTDGNSQKMPKIKITAK